MFFKLFLHTVACVQGYFIIVSKLVFWAYFDECLPFLKVSRFVLITYNWFATSSLSVPLCNIRKSYIWFSLVFGNCFEVHKELQSRGQSYSHQQFLCCSMNVHSSVYYHFHNIQWLRNNHACCHLVWSGNALVDVVLCGVCILYIYTSAQMYICMCFSFTNIMMLLFKAHSSLNIWILEKRN